MFSLLNAWKTCSVEIKAKVPLKNPQKPKICPTRDYVTVYFGLPDKPAKKLKNLAKRQKKSESEVLRKIISDYLKKIKDRKLSYEPLRKFSPIGMRILPRTIRKEQDAKIRKIAEKTGRTISETVRGVIEKFL